MKVAFITAFEGKKKYQRHIDAIIDTIHGAGAQLASPENTALYQKVMNGVDNHKKAEHHYNFIRQSIASSDAVIVESSYQDFQIGHETTLALLYNKPVLCLSQIVDHSKFITHPLFNAVRYIPGKETEHVTSFLSLIAQQAAPDITLSSHKTEYGSEKSGRSILVVGGIYVDIFSHVDTTPRINEVVYSDRAQFELGGKASNAAVALARLGNEVHMHGRSGNDSLANLVESGFIAEEVVIDDVYRDMHTNTGTVLLNVDKDAKFTTIVHESANIRLEKADFEATLKNFTPDALYITLEPQPEFVKYAIKQTRDKTIVMCDAAPYTRPLAKSIYSLVDILAPNDQEASAMTGIRIRTVEDALKACRLLRQEGANTVLITLGAKGSVLFERGATQPVHFKALRVKAVSEVGCGDAFRAAFLSKYLETNNMSEAMNYATIAGAIVATKPGAGQATPTHKEIDFFARRKGK